MGTTRRHLGFLTAAAAVAARAHDDEHEPPTARRAMIHGAVSPLAVAGYRIGELNRRRLVSARYLLAFIALAAGLAAHDLYLRPQTFRPSAGAVFRVEYHNGDNFPSSEAPAKIERLRDMKLLFPGGETPFAGLRIEGTATVANVTAPAQPGNFILISRTIPNFIQLEPAKFEDYLKHEDLTDVIAWRSKRGESGKPGREIYSKYVKSLGMAVRPSANYGLNAGLTIEFIPLANPYELAPGATLPVRLLFRGKPAAGQAVEASNALGGSVTRARVGRTNANGEINIPLSGPGLWKLHTILMERRADSKAADWESFWASLTFEIAH